MSPNNDKSLDAQPVAWMYEEMTDSGWVKRIVLVQPMPNMPGTVRRNTVALITAPETCRGCGGTGWVDDSDDGDAAHSDWPCSICNPRGTRHRSAQATSLVRHPVSSALENWISRYAMQFSIVNRFDDFLKRLTV